MKALDELWDDSEREVDLDIPEKTPEETQKIERLCRTFLDRVGMGTIIVLIATDGPKVISNKGGRRELALILELTAQSMRKEKA